MTGEKETEWSVGRAVSLDRRDLLRLLGTGALGAGGTGLASAQSNPISGGPGGGGEASGGGGTEQVRETGWQTSHRDGFHVDTAVYDDDINRRFYVTTSHSVNYLGATWDPFTNLCEEGSGAWQHTFLVSNFGTGFANRSPDIEPGDAVTEAAYFFDGSKFTVEGGKNTSSTDLSEEDIDASYDQDCTGWSLRYDKHQYYWLDPTRTEQRLTNNEDLLNKIHTEQEGPSSSIVGDVSLGINEPLSPTEIVEEEDAVDTFLEGVVGVAVGEALGAVIDEAASNSTRAAIYGFAADVVIEAVQTDWDLILGNDNITDLYEGLAGKYDPEVTPADDGTQHPNPFDLGSSDVNRSPGTGMAIYFDVYVAPDTETTFSVTSGIRGIQPADHLYSDEPEDFERWVDEAVAETRTHPTWQIEIESQPAPPRDEAGELTGSLRTDAAIIQPAYDDMDGYSPSPPTGWDPTISVNREVAFAGYELTFDARDSNFYNEPDWHSKYDLVWRFGDEGDGYPSVEGDEAVVTHAYETAGEYTVELEIRDGNGGRTLETVQRTVEVDRVPSIEIPSPKPVSVGQNVTFTVPSDSFVFDVPVDVEWDFGDGNTATTDAIHRHTYTELPDGVGEGETGTYTVTLDVWLDDGTHVRDPEDEHTDTRELEIGQNGVNADSLRIEGSERVPVETETTYTATGLETPEGVDPTYLWYKDDVIVADDDDNDRTFTRTWNSTETFELRVEPTGIGGYASATTEITVTPDIEITADLTDVSVDEERALDVSVTDPDGDVSRIVWRADGEQIGERIDLPFGSGDTHSIPYQFAEFGTTTITVEAIYPGGAVSESTDVTVGEAPTVSIWDAEKNVSVGNEVVYRADKEDPDNIGSFVHWEVNGTVLDSTGGGLAYEFEEAGQTTITAFVTYPGGRSEDSVTVSVDDPEPSISIEPNPPKLATGGTSTLEISVSGTTDVDSVTWTIAGESKGTVGPDESVHHTFESTGDISVEAVADYGSGTTETRRTVEVVPKPTVSLEVPPNIEVHREVTFEAEVGNPDNLDIRYSWDVDGNNQYTNSPTLTETFTSTGSHSVSLTVSYPVGSTTREESFDVDFGAPIM